MTLTKTVRKKAALIIGSFTLCCSLNACSPLIIVGATAGAGASIATDRRSTGKIVEDQAIEMQASDFIYSNKKHGKKSHVSVTSVNNIVLLTGEVPNKEFSKEIYNKVMRMRPVKDVINKLEIGEPLSLEDRSNDAWLTSKIKTRILAKKGLLSRTKVITSNGHVYLMGLVNDKEANDVISIVKEVDGISNVTPLYQAYKGDLQQNLTAEANKTKSSNTVTKKTKQEKLEERLQEEDEFTMKPYVIQPAITLTDDE